MNTDLEKRVIAVIHGSDSDLEQMRKGLEYLAGTDCSNVTVHGVYRYSVHHNPAELLGLLARMTNEDVDCIVVGAGWANHLSGMCDRLLRNMFNNSKVRVFAVAFEDPINEDHTHTAQVSITHVPKHAMRYDGYVGEAGFFAAVRAATEVDLATLPAISMSRKQTKDRTIEAALNAARAVSTQGGTK
jgi:hypothetical protein